MRRALPILGIETTFCMKCLDFWRSRKRDWFVSGSNIEQMMQKVSGDFIQRLRTMQWHVLVDRESRSRSDAI